MLDENPAIEEPAPHVIANDYIADLAHKRHTFAPGRIYLGEIIDNSSTVNAYSMRMRTELAHRILVADCRELL
jgi:hypothetical protein